MTAMGKVPRHEFVPIELQPYAYENIPLPIGFEKTISQPFIVALMTTCRAPLVGISGAESACPAVRKRNSACRGGWLPRDR
jgi:hypothetical protein